MTEMMLVNCERDFRSMDKYAPYRALTIREATVSFFNTVLQADTTALLKVSENISTSRFRQEVDVFQPEKALVDFFHAVDFYRLFKLGYAFMLFSVLHEQEEDVFKQFNMVELMLLAYILYRPKSVTNRTHDFETLSSILLIAIVDKQLTATEVISFLLALLKDHENVISLHQNMGYTIVTAVQDMRATPAEWVFASLKKEERRKELSSYIQSMVQFF